MSELQKQLTELAEELEVPGVAAAVYQDGEEDFAFHGVTSVDNPLPVDENTIFQYGSTHKTFTATAVMRLVEQGKVDLHATVRTYLPELKTKDPTVAEQDRGMVHAPGRQAAGTGPGVGARVIQLGAGQGRQAACRARVAPDHEDFTAVQ